MKKEVMALALILVSVVALSFLSYGNFDESGISGNLVWEPSTDVSNCDLTDVESLWNEIFYLSFSGSEDVYFGGQSESNCEFFAKRVVGSEAYLLFYDKKLNINEFYDDGIGGTWTVNNRTNFSASWGNYSPSGISKIEGVSSFEEVSSFYLENGDYDNWTDGQISSKSQAAGNFSEKMKVTAGDFGEVVIIVPLFWMNLEEEVYPNYREMIQIVPHNNSYIILSFNEEGAVEYSGDSEPISNNAINFTGEIDNETMANEGSWQDYINLGDYFKSEVGIKYTCLFLDANNSGGSKVNCSIGSGNVLKFKAAENFTGSARFRVMGENSSEGLFNISNDFVIKIVESLNRSPVRLKDFGDVFLAKGQTWEWQMLNFFDDKDGDDLKYKIEGGENLTFKWNGSRLTVGLGENFTDFDKFYIIADDGESVKKSNEIYVFFSNESLNSNGNNSSDYVKNQSYHRINSSSGNSSEGGNSTGEKGKDDEERMGMFSWIMIIVAALLFLMGLLVLIYIFVLKKKPEDYGEIVENTAQIDNYMQQVSGNGVQEAVQTGVEPQNNVQTGTTQMIVREKTVQQAENPTDKQTNRLIGTPAGDVVVGKKRVGEVPRPQAAPQSTVQEMKVPAQLAQGAQVKAPTSLVQRSSQVPNPKLNEGEKVHNNSVSQGVGKVDSGVDRTNE